MKNQRKSTTCYPFLTTKACGIIRQSEGGISIKNLADELGVSPRTLQRSFKRSIGISPKRFARQVRIKAAVLEKRKNPSLTWTEVTYQFSYFDQMHFIKEFKDFFGRNPSECL